MIDAAGRVAVHTGSRAIPAAGHLTGPQFSVQANLMEKETVWGAMARAYQESPGDLAERLLAALEAAEREGGDIHFVLLRCIGDAVVEKIAIEELKRVFYNMD